MFEIKPYSGDDSYIWNEFAEQSKNATFLFNRAYMDYHGDRFRDASLLLYRKGKLHGLFPANIDSKDHIVYSHQGLTYGGLIVNTAATLSDVMAMFEEIVSYFRKSGLQKLIYKPLPYIYCRYPAQEDLYALFRLEAKLIGRNLSSTIPQSDKLAFTEARKSGLRKAKKNEIVVCQSEDYTHFWKLLTLNLKAKYGVAPVHSLDEITLLKDRFPHHIKHFVALYKREIVAGVVLYITHEVVHVQYIVTSEQGKDTGALDLLFHKLINEEYAYMPYFDFGQSTELMGSYLNENLIFQKEGFGGRGVTYDIYELNI